MKFRHRCVQQNCMLRYSEVAFIVLINKLVIRVRNVHPIVPLKKAKARQINSAVSSMPTWESNTAVSWQPQSLSVARVQCTLYSTVYTVHGLGSAVSYLPLSYISIPQIKPYSRMCSSGPDEAHRRPIKGLFDLLTLSLKLFNIVLISPVFISMYTLLSVYSLRIFSNASNGCCSQKHSVIQYRTRQVISNKNLTTATLILVLNTDSKGETKSPGFYHFCEQQQGIE